MLGRKARNDWNTISLIFFQSQERPKISIISLTNIWMPDMCTTWKTSCGRYCRLSTQQFFCNCFPCQQNLPFTWDMKSTRYVAFPDLCSFWFWGAGQTAGINSWDQEQLQRGSLVCQVCCNRVPQTGMFKKQNLTHLTVWRLGLWNQGVGRAEFFREP